MSGYDLVIRNGALVTPDGIIAADLAVADGLIVAVAPEISGASAAEIDAAGLHVLPGVIDAHVHCNEPGRTEWEGFATATRSLAAGGATSFFDMPLNAHPPTVDAASFDAKLAAAQRSSLIDFALWGGIVPGNREELPDLAEKGVIGFKAFMSNSGIDDFQAVDDLTLYEGMQCATQLGMIVALHAENDQITGGLARRAIAEGRTGVRDYLRSRPVVAELEAIERAILFAEETGCALHIVHVSSGAGVARVAAARQRGVDVTCETCAHYLALTEQDVDELGAVAKCAPPLRLHAEQDALWQHVFDGTLPMVTSDHSPAPASMKTAPNFFNVWGGISGCQSTLSVLLTDGHARRGLPLTTVAALLAENVARRFRLPQKGRVAVGMDADLVLVDMAQQFTLASDDLFYRHQHSPYVGRTFSGRVARTLLRGMTVFQDGKIVSEPVGRLLRPGSKKAEGRRMNYNALR